MPDEKTEELAATMLDRLRIEEVSGVSEPATMLDGWIVRKSRLKEAGATEAEIELVRKARDAVDALPMPLKNQVLVALDRGDLRKARLLIGSGMCDATEWVGKGRNSLKDPATGRFTSAPEKGHRTGRSESNAYSRAGGLALAPARHGGAVHPAVAAHAKKLAELPAD